jgi:calcineurin-like phosphoesterase family protein
MSKLHVISDTHFGHENVAKHRGFSCAQEMDEHIIENWNKTVSKKDVIWLLGDITMEKGDYSILSRLNGMLKFVLGNHDQPNHTKRLLEYSGSLAGAIKLRDCIFTHIPIHPQEFRKFKFNIHGHVHHNTVPDNRYINVCCEAIGYTPAEIDKLILNREYHNWIQFRNEGKDKWGERLCYCGHTNRCDCADPTIKMFKESIERKTIIPNDPNNGWKPLK